MQGALKVWPHTSLSLGGKMEPPFLASLVCEPKTVLGVSRRQSVRAQATHWAASLALLPLSLSLSWLPTSSEPQKGSQKGAGRRAAPNIIINIQCMNGPSLSPASQEWRRLLAASL